MGHKNNLWKDISRGAITPSKEELAKLEVEVLK